MSSPVTNPCPSIGANEACKTYPSPSAEMLNSSAIYSPAQTREFSKTIGEMEADIARVDCEMFRLQEAMDHMQNERRKLESSLDEYRSLVAPIRRIPPEMLSEIFLHCLMDDTEILVAEAPLLLSFVCRRWRTVAISTPQLWSSVCVKSIRKGSISIEMLQIWLLRSCNSPLTLSVNAESFDDVVVARSYINALIPHCRRWQDVEFALPVSLLSMFNAVAGSLPLLQKLGLYIDTLDPFLDAFKVAPMLCDVTFAYDLSPTSIRLPWRQLKRCDVQYSSASVCLYIMQQSVNLVHCKLECLRNRSEVFNQPEAPMLRPHLRSLQLTAGTPVDLASIMDSITAPALDKLEITQVSSIPSLLSQDHLSRFLTRSCCAIQCLRLYNIVITAGELIACLEVLPFLVVLRVTELHARSAFTSEMLDRLTRQKSTQTLSLLVPKLKNLTLSGIFDVGDQAILDMVRSRWKITKPDVNGGIDENAQRVESLKTFSLEISRAVLPETIAQMALWRDEGLEVELYVHGTPVV
jgi:hypothetical protein